MSVTSGRDNSLTGMNNDRPLQVLDNVYATSRACPLSTVCVAWLAPAGTAFVQNPTGSPGNVGRDSVRGPGPVNFDLSLSRVFPLQEWVRLEARFEAFNAINHANFSNPNTNLTSSTFGTINNTSDPRILQFALKLHF